jgi:small subunit ribosomal protein S4e
MPTGHRDHLKRVAAPKSWMLGKMEGAFAIKPLSGPHRSSECIPLAYLLSRFLKYARNGKEIGIILRGKNVKINGRVVTNKRFPVGLFDVMSIEKTNEHFRLLYNIHKKFQLHRIDSAEAAYRLCKVVKKYTHRDVPYVATNCGSIFRFVDPAIGIDDTVKVDLKTRRVLDYIKPGPEKIVFVYKGKCHGRIGAITSVEQKKDGTVLDLVDAEGNAFASIMRNSAVIGTSMDDIWISLSREKGVRRTALEMANALFGEVAKVEAE